MTAVPAAASRRPRVNATLARYLAAFRTPKGMFAAIIIVVITALAMLAPVLFPGGYDEQSRDSFLPMSWAHPFGTDEVGRDLFVRAIYGLRTDLSLVYIAAPISMVLGVVLGLLGAVSATLGTGVQRFFDIILGFPGLILGISIVLVVGTGWTALLITIIIVGLPAFGRLARAALVAQQQREYVLAARTLGVGRWQIMMRHILPNAADPIIVQGTVFIVHSIFLEAALSIVGLGILPPEPSLGVLLNLGMRYITVSPTYVVGPILVLVILAFAFSVLADALNETVNRK